MDIGQINWTENDASNSTPAPDGMPENMNPSGVNDWGRAVMGAVKRLFNRGIPKLTTGTGTAYLLAYTVAPNSYVDGETYLVQFDQANGANATININSLGAIPLHSYSGGVWGPMAAGEITPNMVRRLSYNQNDGSFRALEAKLGTAASFDVGTGANNVVQLDGSGKLPASLAAWSSGDVRLTYRQTPATGWLFLDDTTIGNASSAATHADASYQNLYNILYALPDTICPVVGGRGANAAADWAALKPITLAKALGRAIGIAGAGAGLTARALGAIVGVETHNHSGSTGGNSGGGPLVNGGGSFAVAEFGHIHAIPTDSSMQPTSFLNAEIRL